MNKAYVLSSKFLEYSSLVYAPNRNAARSMRPEGFEECEYIEIDAKRQRSADKWAADGKQVEDNTHRLRALGWYSVEDGGGCCEACSLYEWPDLDESVVCEWCDMCAECGHADGCPAIVSLWLYGEIDEDLCSAFSPWLMRRAVYPQYGGYKTYATARTLGLEVES